MSKYATTWANRYEFAMRAALLADAAAEWNDWQLPEQGDDTGIDDMPHDADEDWGIEDEPCDPDEDEPDGDEQDDDEPLNDVDFLLNPHRPSHEERFM